MSIQGRASVFVLGTVAALSGCGDPTPPLRDSPVLTETPFSSEMLFVDEAAGSTYALGTDNAVFDVADPSSPILAAEPAFSFSRAFHMESPTAAWSLVWSDWRTTLRRREGNTEERIEDTDLASLSGIDGAMIVDFDIGPDAALWVAVRDEPFTTCAVCVRPLGGAFSCASDAVAYESITVIRDGAMLAGLTIDSQPHLSFLRDGVFTELPSPGAGGVRRVAAFESSRALVITRFDDSARIGAYAVDSTGAATALGEDFEWEPVVSAGADGDVLLSVYASESVSDCDIFGIDCTGRTVWEQFVVSHWNGSALTEIGHLDRVGDDIVEYAYDHHLVAVDETSYILQVREAAWSGTR